MAGQRQNQERYRGWYDRKGEERNERRREKYARSPKARKENRVRAKKWREKGAAPTREFYRFVDGKRVRVWTTGQIAAKAGVTPQTLRLWDAAGLLPPPEFHKGHRYYLWTTARKIISYARSQRG